MEWFVDLCYWLFCYKFFYKYYKFFCGVGGWEWLALEFLVVKFYLTFFFPKYFLNF